MELVPFAQWNLPPYIAERLAAQGFTVPTEVQMRCWEPIREGRDLLVQSRTGTGKTLAFALPLLAGCSRGRGAVEVLVVLPTRELAMQVASACEQVGGNVALLYGGGGYAEQLGALQAGVRVVVGTPGRICDHLSRGSLKLDSCRALVLDEADEMLDMGFAEEIDKILAALPARRQSLLFSATLHEQMEELAAKTLRDPQRISVSSGLAVAPDIMHLAYEVEREFKHDALCNILQVERPQSALIFCHTKAEADELSERLCADGMQAACLHGDMSQAERTRTLNTFRRGHLRLLVATDVAARGLDIRGITHVINLSVPREAETYIHRVGRTGRAGDYGMAITLVCPRDLNRFRALLKAAHIAIDIRPLPQRAEVRRLVRETFHGDICSWVEKGVDPAYQVLARELLDYIAPEDALAVLLSRLPQAQACLKAGFDVPVPQRQKSPRLSLTERKAAQKKQRLGELAADLAKLGRAYMQLNVGHSDGVDEEKLTQLLVALSGKPRQAFGKLDMRRHTVHFETDLKDAERLANLIEGMNWEGKELRVRVIEPEPQPGAEEAEATRGRASRREATAGRAGRGGWEKPQSRQMGSRGERASRTQPGKRGGGRREIRNVGRGNGPHRRQSERGKAKRGR